MNKYYITTPIYYANGSPHIGHFLTTSVADALARYHRKKYGDQNVLFTTGLDEHGTSVEQAAAKQGYKPQGFQKYVDERALEWQKAFDDTNISYNYFVRTTNQTHKKFAQHFIQKMIGNDDVYKGTYTGKYCNGCEKFLTLSDQNEEGLCPLHRPDQVTEIKEDNYFFKLSKYAPQIKQLIANDIIKIYPEGKKLEMIARIDQGVEDLSISRPKEKVAWGIEFPTDGDQTAYVWVEALINYLSSLEIAIMEQNQTQGQKEELWQNVVHTLGKDINWFHTVIWPAFLLSARYPLPTKTFVHSFLNISGQKISKSLGNVITPQDLANKYGVDGARYLVLSNLPYKNDVDLTWQLLDEKYNAALANGLGNTVARLTKLAQNLQTQNTQITFNIQNISDDVWEQGWANPLKEFKIDETLQNIWAQLTELDKDINETQPWTIKDEKKLQNVLEQQLNQLYKISIILAPFLPGTSVKIANNLKNQKIEAKAALFPRIEKEQTTQQQNLN